MKKIVYIIFCFMFVSHLTIAQSWQWSKKITQPITYNYGQSKGLLTDKNGNVFSYGSKSILSSYDPHTDTLGSYLQCYSNSGVLLFSKQWKIKFYIQKMEYDKKDHFYFAGKFYGTQTIDGITIVSQGNDDGVLGKMDLSGNILWMKTFGGGGKDGANGICLNFADSSIYITGGIKDTLFFNNSLLSINSQSAIICHYSSCGNLINYKVFDFPFQTHFSINWGVEICSSQSGDFFVLMDRNASRWWNSDPGTGSKVGRYVIKLNANLDTLWSTYINGPQSYWGWSCNNLKVAANGDAYLINSSNGKYGGQAQLLRINGNTGHIGWNLNNDDGIYSDVFLDSNTVYLIGNEGAYVCLCPFSRSGYNVIKKIDENNNVVGETRISTAYFSNITKNVFESIFVTGMIGGKSAIIGADTVLADSILFENHYNYFGKILSKLTDINCTPPIITVSIPDLNGLFYPLCSGDTAVLTVNLIAGSFNWSNGNTGSQTNVHSTGYFSVSNIQPNGCIAYSLPVSVIAIEPIAIAASAVDTMTFINMNTDSLTGTPEGGVFSGIGVSGTNFNPSVAGIGTWPVTYTYTDENGCTDSATINITVELSTSIAMNESEGLRLEIFPNPSSGIFILNFKNKTAETKICVYDVLGKCVFEKVSKNDKEKIDLSGKPKGIYTFEIEFDGKTDMKKIVLQ